MLSSVTETKNAPYLDQEAKNKKNKGTLLSATLKVGENRVPLFFAILAFGPRYGHFCNYKRYIFPVGSYQFEADTKYGRNSRN